MARPVANWTTRELYLSRKEIASDRLTPALIMPVLPAPALADGTAPVATRPAERPLRRARRRQRVHDLLLLAITHLRVERQDDAAVLGPLGLGKAVSAGRAGVGPLAVRAHDAPAGRNAVLQHGLHHRSLVRPWRQPHAVALPIAAGPCG